MTETITYTGLQVLAYDPTRTTTLRTAFVRDMRRRYAALIRVIKEAIIDQDCFGLSVQTNTELTPPYYGAFDFPNKGDQLQSFMDWLKNQEDKGLLAAIMFPFAGAYPGVPWTNTYIEDAYKRGVIRARAELIRQGYDVPSIEASGGIEVVMQGIHSDIAAVQATRTFQELVQTTATMDSHISRVLSQGLLEGTHPRILAKRLIAVINGAGAGDLAITDSIGRFIPAVRRAEMIARTEIIRAHHLANIQEYKTWQVQGVTVIGEFSTAGDDRVCSQCAGYHGNTYTLKEAEYMIPVHPGCRCIILPRTFIKK